MPLLFYRHSRRGSATSHTKSNIRTSSSLQQFIYFLYKEKQTPLHYTSGSSSRFYLPYLSARYGYRLRHCVPHIWQKYLLPGIEALTDKSLLSAWQRLSLVPAARHGQFHKAQRKHCPYVSACQMSFSIKGISLRQTPHQLAVNCNMTTFPLSSDNFTLRPSVSFISKSGAVSPTLTIYPAASEPAERL